MQVPAPTSYWRRLTGSRSPPMPQSTQGLPKWSANSTPKCQPDMSLLASSVNPSHARLTPIHTSFFLSPTFFLFSGRRRFFKMRAYSVKTGSLHTWVTSSMGQGFLKVLKLGGRRFKNSRSGMDDRSRRGGLGEISLVSLYAVSNDVLLQQFCVD